MTICGKKYKVSKKHGIIIYLIYAITITCYSDVFAIEWDCAATTNTGTFTRSTSCTISGNNHVDVTNTLEIVGSITDMNNLITIKGSNKRHFNINDKSDKLVLRYLKLVGGNVTGSIDLGGSDLGGSIRMGSNSGELYLYSTILCHNQANKGSAIGIEHGYDAVYIHNSTIANNTANIDSNGGIFLGGGNSGKTRVTGTLFYANIGYRKVSYHSGERIECVTAHMVVKSYTDVVIRNSFFDNSFPCGTERFILTDYEGHRETQSVVLIDTYFSDPPDNTIDSVVVCSTNANLSPFGEWCNGRSGYFDNTSKCLICPKGFYCDGSQRHFCRAGTANQYNGATFCNLCDGNNKFSNTVGQLQCKDCEAGYYQDLVGATKCESCSRGTGIPVGEDPQQYTTNCYEGCDVGTYNEDHKGYCKMCAKGTYNNRPGATTCKFCPFNNDEGGRQNCCLPGTYDVFVNHEGGTGCFQCLKKQYCLGGKNCQGNRDGILCMDCKENYYSVGNECIRCPESPIGQWILVLLIIVLCTCIVHIVLKESISNVEEEDDDVEEEEDDEGSSEGASKKSKRNKNIKHEIGVGEFQSDTEKVAIKKTRFNSGFQTAQIAVSILAKHGLYFSLTFSFMPLISLPPEIRKFVHWFCGIFAFDVMNFVSAPHCDWKMEMSDTDGIYVLKISMPFVFLFCCICWYNVGVMVHKGNKNAKRYSRNLKNQIIGVALFLWITTLYGSNIYQTLSAFVCIRVGDDISPRLMLNPNIECDQADFTLAISISSLVVFTFIPLVSSVGACVRGLCKLPDWVDAHHCKFYHVRNKRCHDCEHCDNRQRYGWFFKKYHYGCYNYEYFVITQKVAIAAVALFCMQFQNVGLPILIGINLLSVIITTYYQPYLTDDEFIKVELLGHTRANIVRKPCSKQGLTNNCLDISLHIGEICIYISSLIAYHLQETLPSNLQVDTATNISNPDFEFHVEDPLAERIADHYPTENAIIATFDIVGVLLLFSGFFYSLVKPFIKYCRRKPKSLNASSVAAEENTGQNGRGVPTSKNKDNHVMIEMAKLQNRPLDEDSKKKKYLAVIDEDEKTTKTAMLEDTQLAGDSTTKKKLVVDDKVENLNGKIEASEKDLGDDKVENLNGKIETSEKDLGDDKVENLNGKTEIERHLLLAWVCGFVGLCLMLPAVVIACSSEDGEFSKNQSFKKNMSKVIGCAIPGFFFWLVALLLQFISYGKSSQNNPSYKMKPVIQITRKVAYLVVFISLILYGITCAMLGAHVAGDNVAAGDTVPYTIVATVLSCIGGIMLFITADYPNSECVCD